MNVAAALFLTTTLIFCGGYAGMVLMCQIGVLPALRDLGPRSFATCWRAMDSYMEKLMPPYKAALLLSSLLTTVILGIQHRPWLASTCAASFLLSLAGLVLTIRGQLPLNAEIKAGVLSESRILEIREKTSAGFRTRFLVAGLSFVLLCIGVVCWPAA